MTPTQPPKPYPLRIRLRRRTAIVSRWLHLYLSMVSFAIVLFFAVTGLTLNHADWFDAQQKTTHRTGSMPLTWLTSTPSRFEIVEHLRATDKVHGAVSDFRAEPDQLAVSFRAPGYTADTFIDPHTGHYDTTITTNGFIAVLNDLHKGRDAGPIWSWLIDLSAILLTLVSLSGLLLLFFVYKRLAAGLLVAAAGALLSWLVYLHYVP